MGLSSSLLEEDLKMAPLAMETPSLRVSLKTACSVQGILSERARSTAKNLTKKKMAATDATRSVPSTKALPVLNGAKRRSS